MSSQRCPAHGPPILDAHWLRNAVRTRITADCIRRVIHALSVEPHAAAGLPIARIDSRVLEARVGEGTVNDESLVGSAAGHRTYVSAAAPTPTLRFCRGACVARHGSAKEISPDTVPRWLNHTYRAKDRGLLHRSRRSPMESIHSSSKRERPAWAAQNTNPSTGGRSPGTSGTGSPAGCRLNCQLFRLRLIESRQGRSARISEQHNFRATLGAQPFDTGPQILDCSLHQQHRNHYSHSGCLIPCRRRRAPTARAPCDDS